MELLGLILLPSHKKASDYLCSPRPICICDYISDFRYVVLISGLELSSSVDSLLSLELLIDYLSGHLGHSEEQAAVASISRVVIAGMYFKLFMYIVASFLSFFFS